MPRGDSIEGSGFPLGFRLNEAERHPAIIGAESGREVYTVEARKLEGHQKEAVVREGAGCTWRLTSDEGKHLKGTDLAPFPLGFFNAGLHADLIGRILALADARSIGLDDLGIDLTNGYWLTGSFFRGDGEGFAEPATVKVAIRSDAPADRIAELVTDAVAASPALAAMRTALNNTFAIYVNGRRRAVQTMTPSTAEDAPDPFVTYGQPPAPQTGGPDCSGLIRKTGVEQEGEVVLAPAGTKTRIIRIVKGVSRLIDPSGVTETDTWLEMPGMSHFSLRSDERPGGAEAPTGLSLLSAGIAFCFMTQLDRYIEHMKFDIDGVRLVQHCPYTLGLDDGRLSGGVEPVDTHLYLNGREDEETYERLMHIAARTCYLHATLGTALESDVSVTLNGTSVL